MPSPPSPNGAQPTVSRPPSGPLILGRWRVPFFYGWVIVGVCFGADFFASGLGGSTVSLFFKPMGDALGWSLSQMVGATSISLAGGMLLAPVVGRVIDRFGTKPVMLWGITVGSLGMLLMMGIREVWHFWVLYACVAALGLGELGQLTTATSVSRWFARKRGRAIAVATMGQTMGTLVMAPLVAFVIAWLGWRHAWGFMGVLLSGSMLPIVIILMRNRPQEVGLSPDGDPPLAPAAADARDASASTSEWTVREAFRSKGFWILLAAFVLGNAFSATIALIAPYFVQQEGMSNANAGWVLSAYMGSATLARVIWGFLVERTQLRYCMAVSMVFRGLAPVSVVLVPYPWSIVTYCILGGVLGASFGVLQPVVWGNYFGLKSFASIQGTIRPVMALTQLSLPLLLARLFDIQGSFDFGFLLMGVITFVGAAIGFYASPPVKRADRTQALPD